MVCNIWLTKFGRCWISSSFRTIFERWSHEELDTTERLHFHFSLSCIGEGNGNPLQCSCLENPRDGEAWWAAAYGVTQSRTRLKRLGSNSSSSVAEPRLKLRQSGNLPSSLLTTPFPSPNSPQGPTASATCFPSKLLQSCPTLCDPMDYGPPGSSVHGILQARILEWVAMPSSGGSS